MIAKNLRQNVDSKRIITDTVAAYAKKHGLPDSYMKAVKHLLNLTGDITAYHVIGASQKYIVNFDTLMELIKVANAAAEVENA